MVSGLKRGDKQFKQATLAMVLVGFAAFNAMYCTQALLPQLSDAFSAPPSTAALTVSATTGAIAIGVIPVSILSEHFGRGKVLSISLFVATLVGLLLPLSHSMGMLIALRALQGIAISGVPAVAMAWISEEIDPGYVPIVMGWYIASDSIGGLSGRLIPAFVSNAFGWRWALIVNGVVSVVLALIALRALPKQRRFVSRAITFGGEFRAILVHWRRPVLVTLFAVPFLALGLFVTMYNFVGYHLTENFGFPPALVGFLFVLYLSGTYSSTQAGKLSSKIGPGKVLVLSGILSATGLFLAYIPSLPVLIIGLLIFTASFFAIHSTASATVGILAKKGRAEASSSYVFSYYMGSSILGSTLGLVYQDHGWAGLITTLLIGTAILLAIIVYVALHVSSAADTADKK
ncbi:MFS transporter [Corynebacterium pyruviciproducens]